MKQLWFAGNPGLYANANNYNGGGWISSLQNQLRSFCNSDLELSVVFPWENDIEETIDGYNYYGISRIHSPWYKYKTKITNRNERIKSIIIKEHPDIIVVFGTETYFGLVCTMTSIPVIIHIQGMLNAYYETWLPQGVSKIRYYMTYPNPLKSFKTIISSLILKSSMKREITVYKKCRHFFGRTHWDRALVELLSEKAKYYYCNEMIRPEIYNSKKHWIIHSYKTPKIVSIISQAVYKGEDVILRTAQLLKKYFSDNFEWNVYGIKEISFWEKITSIKHKDSNVNIKGIITASELVDVICDANVYVHPSYIENSPNTVCEAQLLGIPVIATNVGGMSSLIKHNEDGLLVPANDPYSMASQIKKVLEDNIMAERIGYNGRIVAMERHRPEKVCEEFMNSINKILSDR